jgi:Tfp pilus assembly protein PilX
VRRVAHQDFLVNLTRSLQRSETGAALLVMVVFCAVLIGGLSFALFEETKANSRDVLRGEAQIRAFEIAETGVSRAEMEIAANTDADGDGLGTLAGSWGGGSYSVVATKTGTDYLLVSTGRLDRAVRVLEQGCRRVEDIVYSNILLTAGAISLTGSAQTDSFDSRVGSYAMQATSTDATGAYAMAGGSIGSNAGITMSGGRVRGDAIPGPTSSVTLSGSAVVTGSRTPRSATVSIAAPSSSEFDTAWTTNDNGNWSGTYTYNSTTKVMTVSGGNTLTLDGGTYFFTKLTLSGGSILRLNGKTTIYVTQAFDTSGGGLDNQTLNAANLEVIVYPYNYPAGNSVTAPPVKFSGGSNAYLTLDAPKSPLTVSGGSPIFGAMIANTATVSSSGFLHYDTALRAVPGAAPIEETYWIERNPPAR